MQSIPARCHSSEVSAVIFDAGDILYDAAKWRRWMTEELNRMGIAISFRELVCEWERELVPVYKGRADYLDAFDSLLEKLIEDTSDRTDFRARSLEAKDRLEGEERRAFEGVRAMLLALRSSGLKLGVLSDTESTVDRVRASLEQLGLAGLFDSIVTSRDIGRVKPEPEAYRAALEDLGATASESLFVAHDQDELDGARDFGMATVAVETTGPTEGHERISATRELFDYLTVHTDSSKH